LSREKTTWKDPAEFAAQRDASTDTTALHFRSSVDGCISENWTSANAKVGLHACWPAASVTLMSPIMPARNPDRHDRSICWFSFRFDPDNHLIGGAEACFTLNIAADVSVAYVQKPLAIPINNPIAPRSSQQTATSAHPVLVSRRTAFAVTVQMTLPNPWVAK
jgi:hypothetical protein